MFTRKPFDGYEKSLFAFSPKARHKKKSERWWTQRNYTWNIKIGFEVDTQKKNVKWQSRERKFMSVINVLICETRLGAFIRPSPLTDALYFSLSRVSVVTCCNFFGCFANKANDCSASSKTFFFVWRHGENRNKTFLLKCQLQVLRIHFFAVPTLWLFPPKFCNKNFTFITETIRAFWFSIK